MRQQESANIVDAGHYGRCEEGARHHGYTGQRGYHPLLAIAAGTGDVLMARLRKGRTNTARSTAHFLHQRWDGCATPEPPDHSPCGPTAASTPMPSSPCAARWMSASQSPSTSTRACAVRSRPYPRGTGRPSRTGWTVPLTWLRPATPPFRVSPTPHRCASSYGW